MKHSNFLNASDGNPVRTNLVPVARSPFLLVGDHAGHAIPARLEGLGVSPADRSRHIALDIGVKELGLALGEHLHAPFIWQHFSRLVCDCNRDPDDPDWIPQVSDGTVIPGNAGLAVDDQVVRRAAIFDPYHDAIAAMVAERLSARRPTVFVSLHSFTPAMAGTARPWDIGVLHDGREDAFALEVLSGLQALDGYRIGDNEPYDMDDTDYTVPRHAYPHALPYIELEVRQDHLSDAAGIARMAQLLATVLEAAGPA